MGLWGVGVHVWVCTTPDYSQIPAKHSQGKQLPPSPSLPSLPPPHLGNLKLIECENYFFFFFFNSLGVIVGIESQLPLFIQCSAIQETTLQLMEV